jgi:hypothetical protein
MNNETEIVDVAEFVAAGKEIPRGRRYRIQIDRQFYVVNEECMTGRELLKLAGKTPPERFKLVQRFRFDRKEEVELDEKVDLATCGVERFVTQPIDCTDGRPPRKEFLLPAADAAFLDGSGFSWETLSEGGRLWVVIRNWPVPDGYTIDKTDVALLIEGGYPIAQIDMAYFHPHLHLNTGKSINALTHENIEEKTYQRWSRHRTDQNPWRPGLDDIAMHLVLVTNWLERETSK